MNEKSKYNLVYFTRNLGEFIFYIYLPLFLKYQNYSGTMIGTLLSFSPLFFIVALPFWNKIQHRVSRSLIIVLSVVLTLTLEYLLIIPTTFTVIALLTIVYSFARAPLTPSIDSMATVYALENKLEFSKIRAWGSFGYLVAVGIGILIFNGDNFYQLIIISTVFMILLISTSLLIKPLNLDGKIIKTGKEHGDLKILLKNRYFIKFLIVQVLCYTAILINTSYDILYITDRGFETYVFGIVTIGRIVFEIILLRIIYRFKFSYKTLYAAMALMMLVPSAIYYFLMPVYMLYVSLAFTGVSMGIILFLNNKYISQIVRLRNITLANYVLAIVQNMSVALMTFLSGIVYDKFGAKYIYLISGTLFLIGFLFSVFFLKKRERSVISDYYKPNSAAIQNSKEQCGLA